jgi:4-alpha-glucanotransferase
MIFSDRVDYDSVISCKEGLLEKVWTNFHTGRRDLHLAFQESCATQPTWLKDYALFLALKNKFNHSFYLDWPEELLQ